MLVRHRRAFPALAFLGLMTAMPSAAQAVGLAAAGARPLFTVGVPLPAWRGR
jgi:hypothetical protein